MFSKSHGHVPTLFAIQCRRDSPSEYSWKMFKPLKYSFISSARLGEQQPSDVSLSGRLASLGIMEDQLRVFLKPYVHHSTIVLRGLRGALIGPPLCRETATSLIAVVFFDSGSSARISGKIVPGKNTSYNNDTFYSFNIIFIR